MPRENRKRGKKHKKVPDTIQEDPKDCEEETAGPSWIIPKTKSLEEPEGNIEAPFGLVDADVKAYFRTVDVQIREWQETSKEENEDADEVDPNEGIYLSISSMHQINVV
jgi:nucleolar protein 9